jgi:hypothetical protein
MWVTVDEGAFDINLYIVVVAVVAVPDIEYINHLVMKMSGCRIIY